MEDKVIHVIKGTVVSNTGSVIQLNNEFESAIQLGEFIKLLKNNEYVFNDDIRAITRTEKSLELRDFMIELDREQMNSEADAILRDTAQMVEDDMNETRVFYSPEGSRYEIGDHLQVVCKAGNHSGTCFGKLVRVTPRYIELSNNIGGEFGSRSRIIRDEIVYVNGVGGRD